MYRKAVTALFVLSLAGVARAAPGLHVYAGAYGWDASPSGTFSSTRSGDNKVDLKNDLGFGSTSQNVFYVGLEHPIPLLPNVRLKQENLDDTSTATVDRTFTYNGRTYNKTETVNSRYQLDQTDLTLYYTPLDTGVKLNLGVTVRKLHGEFEVQSQSEHSLVTADEVVPMGYVGANVPLPLTGLYVNGEVNAFSFSGSSLYEGRIAAGWHSSFGLGVEGGYKQLSVKLSDVDSLNANVDMSGPYLALSIAI